MTEDLSKEEVEELNKFISAARSAARFAARSAQNRMLLKLIKENI